MAYSDIKQLDLQNVDRTSSCDSTSGDEAIQSPWGKANSCNISSVETSTCGASRHSRITEDGSCDDDSSVEDAASSCGDRLDDDDASSCSEQLDDYYDFLRDFAGSFEADDEEEEEEDEEEVEEAEEVEKEKEKEKETEKESFGLEGRPGSQGEVRPQVPDQRVGSRGPAGREHHKRGSNGKVIDDDSASESEDDTSAGSFHFRRDSPASGEYPAPEDDDYDVVKAVQHYAEQRRGTLWQQRCEDMQAGINLRRVQARHLSAVVGKSHIDPGVRAHFARTRIELLQEAKAIERRFVQMCRGC